MRRRKAFFSSSSPALRLASWLVHAALFQRAARYLQKCARLPSTYQKVWQGVAAHVDRCVTMGNPTKQPHVSVPITNPSWGTLCSIILCPGFNIDKLFPMTPLCSFIFIFNLLQKSHRPFSPSFSNRPNQCACTRSLCVSQHQPAGHSALSRPTTPLKGPKRRLAPRPCDVAICRLAGLGWAEQRGKMCQHRHA